MRQQVIEQYEPGMFRKWYDGPVTIMDVGYSDIDIGHATRYGYQQTLEMKAMLKCFYPPYAGTIYIVGCTPCYEFLRKEFTDLDIRLLTV